MLKFVGTALSAATLLAGLATAGEPAMIRKDVAVSYSDLDLSTEAGAKALVGRIEKAAAEACGSTPYFYSSYSVAPGLASRTFNECRANAINSAVKSVNAPKVRQIYGANPAYTKVAAGL